MVKFFFSVAAFANKIYSIVIGRLNVDGTPDTSFSRNGITEMPRRRQMAIQQNGKILVAASIEHLEWQQVEFRNELVLFRLNADGKIDETFGSGSGDASINRINYFYH
ncbi:MAG: hypothetical protein MZV63_13025 [Marinilabiliales bacterium]|nr:hypothetical protein [Marinilabiliales bacterium]